GLGRRAVDGRVGEGVLLGPPEHLGVDLGGCDWHGWGPPLTTVLVRGGSGAARCCRPIGAGPRTRRVSAYPQSEPTTLSMAISRAEVSQRAHCPGATR